jgi:NTE family protein
MSETNERLSIGVCLSGGGFRAAFYALGSLRYLAEAALLGDVDVISAVSGGSIAAAALADRAQHLAAMGWTEVAFIREVYRPFRSWITQHNLRNIWLARSVAAGLRGRRAGRGVVLGETLAEHLYHTQYVADLPPGPQVLFTSTDLATARAFRISRDFVGNFDFGYVEPAPRTITLGVAIGASAALPAFFPPTLLPTEGLGLRNPPPVLSLVDGGVYDNLGLEWFQGWGSGRPSSAIKPDFLVVVNASGTLKPAARPYGSLSGLLRTKDVLYNQTTSLRVRWLVRDFLAGRERGIYLGIRHDPRGYKLPDGTPIGPELHEAALPSDLVPALAALRTDLDRFLPEEADLLSYHGYWSMHARLMALHPRLGVAAPTWREFASLSQAEVTGAKRLLEAGARRRISRSARDGGGIWGVSDVGGGPSTQARERGGSGSPQS